METNKKDTAFGYGFTSANGGVQVNEKGLNKREYFSGLAMQGYVSAEYTANSGMPHEQLAEWSVQMADALILALNK